MKAVEILSKQEKPKIPFKERFIHMFKYKKLYMLNVFVLIALGILMIYPLFYAFLGSLSTKLEFNTSKFLPLPKTPFTNLSNYLLLFTQEGLMQSIIITFVRIVWTFVITSLVSVFGGYAFARLNFTLKRTFFMFLLSTMMIPGVAMMIPNYIWMAKLGFVNNPAIYFITGWVSAYNIFLFRQAFYGFGKELVESARVDGAGFVRTMFSICIPLVKPLLVVLLINSFIGVWNDYMTNIVYLNDLHEWHTVGSKVVDLTNYYSNPSLHIGGADYPKAYAILVLMMLPPVVLFACMQKQFVAGLTAGAVKG